MVKKKDFDSLGDVFAPLEDRPNDLEALRKAKKLYEGKDGMGMLPNSFSGLSFAQALKKVFPHRSFDVMLEQLAAQPEEKKKPVTMSLSKKDLVKEPVKEEPKEEQGDDISVKEMKLSEDERKKLSDAVLFDAGKELADLRKKVAGHDVEVSALNNKIADLEEEKAGLEAKNADLKIKADLASDLQTQLSKKVDLEKTQEIDGTVIQPILQHHDEMTQTLAVTRANLEQAKADLGQAKLYAQSLEDQITQNAYDSAVDVVVKKLRSENADSEKKLTENKNVILQKDAEIKALAQRIDELLQKDTDLGVAQRRIAVLEKESSEIPNLKEELSEAKKSLTKAQEAVSNHKVALGEEESKSKSLQNKNAALASENIELKAQLKLDPKEMEKKLAGKDKEIQEKLEEIGILEEKIEVLQKQIKPADPLGTEILTPSTEELKNLETTNANLEKSLKDIEDENETLVKKNRKLSLLGRFTLIPPLFLLFFPFTPKRTWGGIKAVIAYPVGIALNLAFWVLIAYGGLNVAHHFVAPAKPEVKGITTETFDAIKGQAEQAHIYYEFGGTLNDGQDRMLKSNVQLLLDEQDAMWKEKLKAYVLKTEAEADLKKALATNDASWLEKLKAYVPKTEAEAAQTKALADNGVLKNQRDSIKRQFDDASSANKSLTEKVGKLEGEIGTLKQQLTDAQKNGGTVNSKEWEDKLKAYILKTEADEAKKLALVKNDADWQKALDTLQNDLKTEKAKVSVLINEKAVLKQTADLVPGLNQQLDSLKVYRPAIDEIKIIFMDDTGFIDCPTDKPDGSMNWYVNSFLKRGYSVSQKVQLQKTGLIAVHYAGASLIKDYKGTRYYLVVKAETPPQKK